LSDEFLKCVAGSDDRLSYEELERYSLIMETVPGGQDPNEYFFEENLFIGWESRLDNFFDACTGLGVMPTMIREVLQSLETDGQRQAFLHLVANDPRALRYGGRDQVTFYE